MLPLLEEVGDKIDQLRSPSLLKDPFDRIKPVSFVSTILAIETTEKLSLVCQIV